VRHFVWVLVVVTSCSLQAAEVSTTVGGQEYPTVTGVVASLDASGTFSFDVTMSSPYDTPARYADGWRVVGADGTVYGVRVLTHDHANEQPFTRSLGNVEIPLSIVSVYIEGRDLANGWGGEPYPVQLPGR
jgi:hypothetical protein